MPLILLNLLGVFAFIAPFFLALPTSASTTAARASDAPWLLALIAPLLVGAVLAEMMRGGLDSKSVALLGVLAACSALLRLPFSFAGANLFFFLPICAGFVFGSTFGFLLGSLGIAASALISGGVGPWLPFQMFAAGWIGAGSGALRGVLERISHLPRLETTVMCAYGALAAFIYGGLLNLYFWPVMATGNASIGWQPGLGLADTLHHYRIFYLLTSAGWDSMGALANALLLAVLGPSVLFILRRHRQRFSFTLIQPPITEPEVGLPTKRSSTRSYLP
ncbi:MAG TPA: ECF transporter S component [Actinomycetota bacterium]|nr:ECF transporter S component [Actinomycetota bacterium]